MADTLSIVALVVSLVALVIAVAQALQQYISTAEGLRKCQESVIGNWYHLTRRKFRFSELRFETIFVSPHFEMLEMKFVKEGRTDLILPNTGPPTLPISDTIDDPIKAKVTWLTLLRELAGVQTLIDQKSDLLASDADGLSYPALTKQPRSWDFMPPDVVRPFATAPLGDVLRLGHRLGMKWHDINLSNGELRAEGGNGNSISSTLVRGLGTLVNFSHDEGLKVRQAKKWEQNMWKNLYIPNTHADKYAFGIIAGDPDLGFEDVNAGTKEEILRTMESFDTLPGKPAYEKIRSNLEVKMIRYSGWADLMPIVAPWVLIPGCSIHRIPRPTRWFPGPLFQVEGYIVFRNRIKEFLGAKDPGGLKYPKIKWVSDGMEEMYQKRGRWDFEASRKPDNIAMPLYDQLLKEKHQKCTGYLIEFNELSNSDDAGRESNFSKLAKKHVCHAFSVRDQAHQKVKDQKEGKIKDDSHKIKTYGQTWGDSLILCAVMNSYIDHVEVLAEEMAREGLGGARQNKPEGRSWKDEAIEAWWVMIFRALLWNRSILTDGPWSPGTIIPSKLWRSQIPVYIG